ncbi:4Fe-4S dicluster domain-containing protein [Massilia forsythiae]|uniref:4Fe-4S dicluster domain-containing protein n=2 Tax=Massilia forsythiae TaxID=2728020 RepID=A0A7Z2W2B0_9BURK|nr:4Fe-4S dicluster domain-containing protein [Massilia forsythiae]
MWSDARAHDGTASIVQPVIAPLYGGRSEHALLAMLLGREGAGPGAEEYAAVRRTWAEHADGDAGLSVNGREDADANRRQHPGVDGGRAAPTILGAATAVAGGGAADPRFDARFEGFWQEALRRGVIDGSAAAPLALKAGGEIGPPPARLDAIEIVFKPDPGLDGGEFANNAWLQEWPRPLTQLTWDNAALLGPGTAAALKVIDGERLRIEVAGRTLEAPVLVLPEQADGVVTLPLGYGRAAAGNVGNGVGFDAYRLRSLAALDAPAVGRLTRAAGFHTFALRQKEDDMHGRSIVRLADLQEFTRKPAFANALERDRVPEHSLYPQVPYKEHKWGMAIDLNACIGCGTCTLACQAENNIPTVGKEEVLRGRIMHWIRVDRYRDRDTGRKGAGGRPRTLFQPVPCMHCEQAPCEEVCPVGATVHDSEGLNVQVYNRCVGTRFCSNNCPYKVRRFNFLQYADASREQIKASRNPEVTVRRRGVMEKCTFCLQRITRARIDAEKLGRGIQDGEVVTACQAACPTSAIVFGDLNDKSSAVVRAKASPLDYALLAELNTRPRTTYAARVVNPDPELE